MSLHTPRCFANHMGAWACEPRWLQEAVGHIRAGTWTARAFDDDAAGGELRPPAMLGLAAARPVYDAERRFLYWQTEDGVAIVEMSGPLMKQASKYGGAGTVDARRAIRAAVATDDIGAIMLHIDSPGGHVAGTQEMADEVKAADKHKPVHAHIDDLGASAAYWIASAARRISVNAMGEVGSIGVYAVIYDSKGMHDEAGVKVHVVGTGGMKGAFTDGTEVTEDQLAYLRTLIDHANGHFVAAVQKHRGMSPAKVAKVTDGRVFPSAQALELGLVDAVQSYDRALAELAKEGARKRGTPKRDRMAAIVDLARLE